MIFNIFKLEKYRGNECVAKCEIQQHGNTDQRKVQKNAEKHVGTHETEEIMKNAGHYWDPGSETLV